MRSYVLEKYILLFVATLLSIVNFELYIHKKNITNPVEFRAFFAELLESSTDFTRIYADESKDANKVALAVVYLSFIYSCRLPDKSSLFTAELIGQCRLTVEHVLIE